MIDNNEQDAQKDGKPNEPGRPGEVKNGYRWDQSLGDWVRHVGIDFSKDQSRLPYNFEHAGDGSPEHPHRIVHVGRWI